MKQINYNILLVLLAIWLAGCSSDEQAIEQEPQQDETPVVADLVFTVSHSVDVLSRMYNAVVQEEGHPYRGIEIQYIIPFAVAGEIGVNDRPKMVRVMGTGQIPVNARAYYYYENCSFMPGVASFLSYGRAPLASENKAINGSIVETFPADMAPKNIRFSLESISAKVVNTKAWSLASYMTNIANASANDKQWKDTENKTLQIMYENFINQVGAGSDGEILPGSSLDVKAYAQALKTTLNGMSLTTDDDIALRTAIIDKIVLYNNDWDGFPASIGLPDGAAVIRWVENNSQFEPQISNTSLADINGIDRFVYPAEIYYYGNSRINTSIIDKRYGAYTDVEWSSVLAQYENVDGVVTRNTTAVAIKDPLQYGVARAQVKLIKTDEATLNDAKGTAISVGTTNFPLTGIIIGGQLPVGFDFKPTTTYPVYSEADMTYIYDSQVKINGEHNNEYFYLSSSADAAKAINTLVLQSYDNRKIPVVLEFINNSDRDFKGLGGVVLRGTKFYLAGEIDPAEFSEDPRTEIRDRVFTQDYTTTLNLKVKSLEKAYNVVPNLLSPRLEMGVELVSKWVSTTPEEVLF